MIKKFGHKIQTSLQTENDLKLLKGTLNINANKQRKVNQQGKF